MSVTSDVAGRIDTIESGYEYLLAYAAQGRQDESGSEVREKLLLMRAALDGLGELLAAAVGAASREGAYAAEPFLQAVHADAAIARGAINLVLGRAALGSLLIDNLNASVHLRALLTDLFLIEQALKAPPAPQPLS